jgi:hypothetical protein
MKSIYRQLLTARCHSYRSLVRKQPYVIPGKPNCTLFSTLKASSRNSPLDPVARELEVRGFTHLEEVLQSERFKRATTLRGLLVYLWRNKGKEIDEYAIAVDALGRNRDFDSRIDASVRVQISRLRQFLTKYYESEGRLFTARMVIPMGTHQIQLIEVVPKDELRDARLNGPENDARAGNGIVRAPPSPEASSKLHRLLVPVLSAVIAVLVLCIASILWPSFHSNGKSALASKQERAVFVVTPFSSFFFNFNMVRPG